MSHIFFPNEGSIFLVDDYRCDIHYANNLYPSVRHAVLCRKTTDPSHQKRICETLFPYDLKDLERSIAPAPHWNAKFALAQLIFFTRIKFNTITDLSERLKATKPAHLVFKKIPTNTNLAIDELQEFIPHYGAVLMQIRKNLQ